MKNTSPQFLVPDAWVDVEHARTAIDRAEGALRHDAPQQAWAHANVAAAIASQSFLPDEQHVWVQQQREMVARVLRRALVRLATLLADRGITL